jgi:hypothetical protein
MKTAHDQLEAKAEGVRSDIGGDHPDVDTSYDLWVEELRHSVTGSRVTYGVIQMGDAYTEAFEWDGREWHPSSEDAHSLVDRIIRHREHGTRYAR